VAWYALVLLGPPTLTFAAVALNLTFGATPTPGSTVPGAAALVGQFAHRVLAAALLVGLIHTVWHLPLFGVEYHLGGNMLPWAITVVAVSVVVAWVWVHTGGSLLLPMLLHASNNAVTFVWRWFDAPDQLRLWWTWAALWVAAAVVVVAVNGRRLTRAVS